MGGYSFGELGSILVMQGFAGLILFSVFLLMALGLAIIFGQMGVINMAHGEFMILGAYMTFLTSHLFQTYLPPVAFNAYFFVAMVVAFIVSGSLGLLVEWAMIQHLYKRPLDTLLATWGLSLILQQAYRSIFGAREVGVELPNWMMGSLTVTDGIDVQINGLFVMGLTLLITVGVFLLMFRSRWGLQVRAVVNNRTMSGAVGIDNCRQALHRRHLPRRRVRRRTEPDRHHRIGLHHLAVAVHVGILHLRLNGQGHDPAYRHRAPDVASPGPVRTQSEEMRRAMSNSLFSKRSYDLIGFALLAILILIVLPITLDNFRLNLVGKYLTYSFVALGLVLCWGYPGILSLGRSTRWPSPSRRSFWFPPFWPSLFLLRCSSDALAASTSQLSRRLFPQ